MQGQRKYSMILTPSMKIEDSSPSKLMTAQVYVVKLEKRCQSHMIYNILPIRV